MLEPAQTARDLDLDAEGVVQAQQETTTVFMGEQIVKKGRADIANMQTTGRRGRKAYKNCHPAVLAGNEWNSEGGDIMKGEETRKKSVEAADDDFSSDFYPSPLLPYYA